MRFFCAFAWWFDDIILFCTKFVTIIVVYYRTMNKNT